MSANKYRPPHARQAAAAASSAATATAPAPSVTERLGARPSFATPPLPRHEVSPSPSQNGFDAHDNISVLRKYFATFNGFSTEPLLRQRTVKGGNVQQIFVAELEVPNDFGAPIIMTAEGSSKKAAKNNLLNIVRQDLDSRGWLADRIASTQRPRAARGKGSRAANNTPQPRPRAENAQWDQGGVRPIKAEPQTPIAQQAVPSAWDDEVPVKMEIPTPQRGGRNQPAAEKSWDHTRITPIPRQQPSPRSITVPRGADISAWDEDGTLPDTPTKIKTEPKTPRIKSEPVSPYQPNPYAAQPDAYSQQWTPPGAHTAQQTPSHSGSHNSSWFADTTGLSSPQPYASQQYNGNGAYYPPQQNPLGGQMGFQPSGYQPHGSNGRSFVQIIPPPNVRLPTTIDDVERKFVEFYCKTHGLSAPSVHISHVTAFKAPKVPTRKGRYGNARAPRQAAPAQSRSEGWDAEMVLPSHTFEAQEIQDLRVVAHDRGKKVAEKKAWQYMCNHLLSIVNERFVEIFRVALVPIKQRIKEMLDEPIKINLTESAIVRLDAMLSQLRDADAFHFSEPKAEVLDTLGLSAHRLDAPLLMPKVEESELVRPEDVKIPRELEQNQLPIFTRYREIIAAIDNNPVTVLSAETGAGKTTQLPQFLLAHIKQRRAAAASEGRPQEPPANIVITQPRRIAAISVAQRVASERKEVVGTSIGYQVRFDDKRPTGPVENGHAVFCTSGILLKRLQGDPYLRGVTHIILDEVHERDLNTDLLLIIVRQLIQQNSNVRVVLMSATAETELFQDYFRGFGTVGPRRLPPIIQVAGRMFPVQQYFLEDVDRLLHDSRALPAPFRPARESVHWVQNETGRMEPPRGEDPVPYDYLEALIVHICATRDSGAVLCFLPGLQEIDTLMSRLKDDDRFGMGFNDERRFRVYPLHSSVPIAAQQFVFDVPPAGVRKIILSTNIAETSVTINDIVYVIDSGKMRMNSYDADRRISSLNSVWASLSNLRQRSGRAGRCQPGMYFSLLSHQRKQTIGYSMPPELLRVDLQSTVLKVKSLRLSKHVSDVFSAAPQPPSPGNVINAVNELYALGALDEQENMTSLGEVLSTMPVDPWIGKMVLEAATLGCLDPILTIAGGMEIGRGVYAIHPEQREEGRAHILSQFAAGTDSDHLTLLNAFRAWSGSSAGRRPGHEARNFARANYLHHNSLANVERSRQQLLRILEDCGLVSRRKAFGSGRLTPTEEPMGGADLNAYAYNSAMIRAILCGALYPNVAEITAKDEYGSRTDYKLRLTSSTVNSWKGVVGSAAGANAAAAAASGRATPGGQSSMSDLADYDYIPEDDSAAPDVVPITAAITAPPLPPRLLSFQEKQRVDGGLYLRNTTRADAASLFLFADGAGVMTNWRDGRPELVIDGWIRVGIPSAMHARVLLELRLALGMYIKWAVWSRQQKVKTENHKEWDRLGKMLVREIVAIVEDGEEDAVVY
ncbi:ATP-dependent DNA/RNA helicase dhx36 [Geranomyces variabilis]|nr:ATP-dependent DNA/RNA helicase dhx36 [Geranomyces variabilis]